MAKWIVLLFVQTVGFFTTVSSEYHDYCVVGAGPGGLQLGYFLKSAGRDYVIFEKSNCSGNFFRTFPRHRTLISVNKRNTGRKNKEFNLRHDWNSLISDDESLLLRHYSRKMFPHADDIVRYFNDYQKKLNLKVYFNTEVNNIRAVKNSTAQDGVTFNVEDQNKNKYKCRTLIVATGLGKPFIPNIEGIEFAEGYESISIDPVDYEGKSVLIIGKGNSAFETASSIYGNTAVIHLLSRDRVRMAWSTHYVGDVRAVNNDLLDTYQLKSLDAVTEGADACMFTKDPKGKYKVHIASDKQSSGTELFDNFALRSSYDKIIRCTGFQFDKSLWHESTNITYGLDKKSKFPAMSYNYESIDYPGLYYAGGISHYLDFRKSAGGFIHGYRYTARALHKILEKKYEGKKWPSVRIPVSELHNNFIRRMNEASGIYQMFAFLCDIAIISEDGLYATYIEEFPVGSLPDVQKLTGYDVGRIIVLVLQYGPTFSHVESDVFDEDRATIAPAEAHRSNFLHPAFYFYKTVPTGDQMKEKDYNRILPKADRNHFISEDFLTKWDAQINHILPLRRFIETCVGKDLRNYFAEDCFRYALTRARVPLSCQMNFLQGRGFSGTKKLQMIHKIYNEITY